MPPWWKIRRELVRPFRQLASLPLRFGSLVAGRWYYDTFLRKHKRIEYGSYPLSSKVCIYVVYPTTPECASQLVAIKSLREDGFSVLVVSNKYLDESLRQKILSFASVLIERVNFGYDFGAYREGVLYLYENKLDKDLSYLMLMNDSCWYPMSSVSWPALAMSLEKDFVGATSAYGISRRKLDSDPHKHWLINKAHRNFHYASYALMIGRNVFGADQFENFFRFFALTNNKKHTVRRGEIGLTRLVKKINASHTDTHSADQIPEFLSKVSTEELLELVEQSTLLNDNHLVSDKAQLLKKRAMSGKECPGLRYECEAYLLRLIARQGLCYAMPNWLITQQNFPLLKKSLPQMNANNAAAIRRFCDKHKNDLNEDVRNEILVSSDNQKAA
jgi:hypothetical protein